MIIMSEESRYIIRKEKEFFKDEYTDHFVYMSLLKSEKHRGLRALLEKMAAQEQRHMMSWERLLNKRGVFPRAPMFISLRVVGFRIMRRFFGTAFMTKVLERNETNGIEEYSDAIKGDVAHSSMAKAIREILKDERGHQRELMKEIEAYEGSLEYIKSIVFGLNDGLVEILAAVAGLAALATTSSVVIAGGIIVAVSGTLSMAGGAYLASKSQNIVSKAVERDGKMKTKTGEPMKDAYYTGVFYFLGALVPILPFIFGAKSYLGIALAMIFDIIVLTVASIVIAVVSDTSVKRRTFEMIAISIGAALVTIVIGTIARVYFGIVV